MCGINGVSSFDVNLVTKMNEASRSRGPDASNLWYDNNVTFGHNLLNLVADNVEQAIQPYVTDKGNVMTFNGQIYDCDQLDTPYLAQMLDYYGVSWLNNVNGVFAIAWYQPQQQTITLIRDHYGQRPLYYSLSNGRLTFSSSIHAMQLAVGNKVSWERFGFHQHYHRYLPGTITPYKNIDQVAPGQYLVFSLKTKTFIAKGTLHDWKIEQGQYSDAYVKQTIECAIEGTVRNQQSVRRAVMLSSGLDSTSVLNGVRKLTDNVFAVTSKYVDQQRDVDFETKEYKQIEEYDYAHKTAEFYGINILDSIVERSETESFSDTALDACKALGMPMFDNMRLVPRYLAIKCAAENGAKIILTGDGGDEIFLGYNFDRDIEKPETREYIARQIQKTYDVEYFAEWFPHDVFGNEDCLINNERFMRLLIYSPGNAIVNEGLAAHFSMEARTPFPYQQLIRVLLSIPGETKFHNEVPGVKMDKGIQKYYLRHLFRKELPPHIVFKKTKAGWSSPWGRLDAQKARQQAHSNMKMLLSY